MPRYRSEPSGWLLGKSTVEAEWPDGTLERINTFNDRLVRSEHPVLKIVLTSGLLYWLSALCGDYSHPKRDGKALKKHPLSN
jgi:hypothetical protein